MRAYFFSNMYLNGIQHGIQAGHAFGEMWNKYDLAKNTRELDARANLALFTASHKTFIVLNGGDVTALRDVVHQFWVSENPYPWAEFREPGLGFVLTSVGIIVPEKLYDARSNEIARRCLAGDESVDTSDYTAWELWFIKFRVSCPLAI